MTSIRHIARTLFILAISIAGSFAATKAAQPPRPPSMHPTEPGWVGGCGGVYFLTEPGELIVEVQKRDRNRHASTTELRAILVSPDRQVLDELHIPDAGEARGSGWGHSRGGQLRARVPRRGIYGLNITVSQDRYGEQIAWSFRSNCSRYVVETSRGHSRAASRPRLAYPSPPGTR